jgi:glucose-1-phosphate adenylyltransferase
VLVVAGDHIYKMDYGRMLAIHAKHQADMTVACIDVPLAEASEFGVMGVDEHDRVIDFVEKPQNPPPMPGQPGPRAGLDGRLHLQRQIPFRAAGTRRTDRRLQPRFRQGHHSLHRARYRVFAHRFADSCVGSDHHSPTGATSAPSTPTGKPTWR